MDHEWTKTGRNSPWSALAQARSGSQAPLASVCQLGKKREVKTRYPLPLTGTVSPRGLSPGHSTPEPNAATEAVHALAGALGSWAPPFNGEGRAPGGRAGPQSLAQDLGFSLCEEVLLCGSATQGDTDGSCGREGEPIFQTTTGVPFTPIKGAGICGPNQSI